MKLKWWKILIDPAFWVLLGVNIYLVYKYEQRPEIFTTLIWLYWSQSILYGLFCYLDIRTSKKFYASGFNPQPESKTTIKTYAEANITMFTFIYSAFHIVYFIFIAATFKKTGPFDWDFFWSFLGVFGVFQLISFVQHKVQNKDKAVDITKMTTRPFLRVLPMHLCILIPAFLSVSNLTIFLVVKVITDVIMYVVTTSYYQNKDLSAVTAINIQSTISS